jgi:zinc/manganese transport system permease protein
MFAGSLAQAWIVGSIVAILSGVVGQVVVSRRSVFAAHALPNGAFAGAAGAVVLGLNPLVGLVGVSVLGAFGIGALSRRERSDVATALTLVVMLAVGSTFLALSGQYEEQTTSLLFGEVLGISLNQVLPTVVLAVGCVMALGALRRPLALVAASGDLAAARGVRTTRLDMAFLVVLAVATAVAVPVVGALLTFALMVGPPGAARLLTRTTTAAVALSAVFSVLCVWSALALAYVTGWPVGFFVGVGGAVLYGAARTISARRPARREGRSRSSIPAVA